MIFTSTCGQSSIDIQDRLVLCFRHEKAMPYQKDIPAFQNVGPDPLIG